MANESCQILTVSSTIKEALTFIESEEYSLVFELHLILMKIGVKSLAGSSGSGPLVESVPLTVPWTITNKYYVADVHFSVWTVDKVFVELFERESAALVFVWTEGEVGLFFDFRLIVFIHWVSRMWNMSRKLRG